MNHADVKRYLADYLEGDLDLDARALVDAHLDQCPECSTEVAEMQQTIRLLRLLPEPETPPMIAADVMRRIRAGEAEPGWFGRLGQRLGAVLEPSFVLPASAIAAAALVLVVLQTPEPTGGARFSSGGEDGGPAGGLIERRSAVDRSIDAPLARRFEATSRVSVFTDGVLPPASTGGSGGFLIPELFSATGGGLAAAPPRTGVLRDPSSGGEASLRTVSQPLFMDVEAAPRVPYRLGGVGGDDPRDLWLARILEDPRGFARYLAGRTLAEQELWVARLSERAESRGLLNELTQTLRASGDDAARWLASDFEAQAGRAARAASGAGGSTLR